MKQITDQQIRDEAKKHLIEGGDTIVYYTFINGAKWIQEQMQPEWIKWGDEGSNDITQNSLVLFDNGDILRYCEEWPFAEVTHFFIVPDPSKF